MKSLQVALVGLVLAVAGLAGFTSSAWATSPANDDFADAQQLTGKSNVFDGSTVSSSIEAGEPVHPGSTSTKSAWFKWTAPIAGTVVLNACADQNQTGVMMYTGSAVNSLTAFGTTNGCRAQAEVTAGTELKIAAFAFVDANAESFRLIGRIYPKPANDDFANPEVLNGSSLIATGNTGGASKEGGEPDHFGSTSQHSVWYRWTALASGAVAINVCGLNVPGTALAAYAGDSVNSLSVVEQGYCGFRIQVTEGTTLRIAVSPDGSDNVSPFTLRLKLFAAPANDDFANAQVIPPAGAEVNGQNGGADSENSEPVPGTGATVWYSWTAPTTGMVLIDACNESSPHNFRVSAYLGGSVGGLSFDNGSGCRSTFKVFSGTDYKLQVDGESAQDTGDFKLRVSMPAAPANDNLVNATPVNTQTVNASGTYSGASLEPSESDPGLNGAGSVWYSWTAPTSNQVTIDTCGSNFDTYLGVYQGSSFPLSLVGKVDDTGSSGCGLRSAYTFTPTAGQVYKIGVYAYSTIHVGKYSLRINPGPLNPLKYTITTSKVGTGSGTIVRERPYGINCGDDCSDEVNDGTQMLLQAIPDEGSVFVGWQNQDSCYGIGSCWFPATSSKTVSAYFKDVTPKNLDVEIAGNGAGTVTSSPTGINCPGTCSGEFDVDTVVTLTANPASGSEFLGWTGACEQSENACLLTMDDARSTVATFGQVESPKPFSLKLGKPKLNLGKGTALLPVTVNKAARITLAGKNVKKRTAVAKKARTVKIQITALRKLRATLRKKGKAVAKVKVTAKPTAGGKTVTRTRKVTLRLRNKRS